MNRPWKALLLALAVGGAPSLAGSQLEPPALDRYLRWGPVRVRPAIQIKELGYDDNVLIPNTAEPIPDYVLSVAPKVDGVVLLGSRAFLTFGEELAFAGYRDNSDLNYIDQRGSARLMLPRDRIGLFVDVTLNRVNERPVDDRFLRSLATDQRLGLGLVLEAGWRTEVAFGRSRTDLSYEDDGDVALSSRLSRDITRDFINVGYRIQGRTRLTLDADRRSIEFTRKSPTDIISDSDAWSILPGVTFGEGGRLTGVLRAGWADVEPDDQSLPDLKKFIGDAELAYRPNRRWTWKVKGWRAPGFTTSGTDVFYIETQGQLGASLFFTRFLGLEAGGGRGRITYPGAGREDRIQRYDAALLLRISENALGRRVQYRLGLRQYRRRGTTSYSTTTIGMSAVVGF